MQGGDVVVAECIGLPGKDVVNPDASGRYDVTMITTPALTL